MKIKEFIDRHGGSVAARRKLVAKGIIVPWNTWACWMNQGPKKHREPPPYVVDALACVLKYGRKPRIFATREA